MPRIPTYTARMDLPATAAGEKVSIPVATLPAQATQRLGLALERVGDKIRQAEQVSELSSSQVEARRRLQELQDSFEQRTDFEAFEQEAALRVKEIKTELLGRIRDPEVKRAFAPQFESLALTAITNIKHRAQRLRIQHSKAQALKSIDELSKLYEGAPAPDKQKILGQITAAIQAGAAAGLWTEVDALKMLKAKTKELRYAEALAEIDQDPDGFNPDKYKDLDEKTRITLKAHAQSVSHARLSQTLTLIKFQQQQEDRRAKELRDQVTADFTVRALKGELTPQEVYDAAHKRIIKDEDVTKLVGLIEKGGLEHKDDPWTRLYLVTEIAQGRGRPEQVMEAYQAGMLTPKSAEEFLEKIYQARKEKPPIMDSPEYKMALDYIETITNPPGSLLDKPDFESMVREQYAKQEFYERVVLGGEPMDKVVADIEARYKKRALTRRALPRPMFGDRTNLAEAYRKTVEAYKAGCIDRETYERELRLIYRLKQMKPGLVAEEAEGTRSVADKIKEREARW